MGVRVYVLIIEYVLVVRLVRELASTYIVVANALQMHLEHKVHKA